MREKSMDGRDIVEGEHYFDHELKIEVYAARIASVRKSKMPDPNNLCRNCVYDPHKHRSEEMCQRHPCEAVVWVDLATFAQMRLTQ